MGNFFIIILVLVIAALLFILGVHIVEINLNDMIHNGVNFWNVFWIMLVLTSGGGGASLFKRS